MKQLLKNLWNKYTELKTWQKVLLFVPLIIGIILVCILMFWKPSNDGDKFEEQVEYTKDLVDSQVQKKQNLDKELEKKEQELSKKEDSLREKIKDNEKQASNFISAITNAANTGNVDELLRIQRELNNRK